MKLTEFSNMRCPHCGGATETDPVLAEKKDACYHKVRSRYKVWPSAYASGALVQCRKKGAANWGNKSESVAEAADNVDERATENTAYRFVDMLANTDVGRAARNLTHQGKLGQRQNNYVTITPQGTAQFSIPFQVMGSDDQAVANSSSYKSLNNLFMQLIWPKRQKEGWFVSQPRTTQQGDADEQGFTIHTFDFTMYKPAGGQGVAEEKAGDYYGYKEYPEEKILALIRLGNWEANNDVVAGKMVELRNTRTGKTVMVRVARQPVSEVSDPSGLMHAAKNLNKVFRVTAKTAEGDVRRFRVRAQSERVAREKFSQHYNQATVQKIEDITDQS